MRRVLALLSALAPALASAQELQPVETDVYIPISPISRQNPNYPSGALTGGKEGWVMLSFVVSETGAVEEAMIEDSSGVEAFELAALDAIRKWRYAPATLNGNPVAQSMQHTRISFALEGPADGATRQFVSAYRKTRQLLDAGDYAAAAPLLEEMELGGRYNLYEDALFWALKYAYLEGVQSTDTAEKIRALKFAIGSQYDEHLPSGVFVAAAHSLYILQVQALDLSAARQTFERLRDSPHGKRSSLHASAIAELTPTYEQIEQLIAGRELLPVKAEIDRYGYWDHDLMRRSFSLANVTGSIASVSVRCERGTRLFENYPDDAVWHVPESWGKCGIYIKGDPATTFTFEEYPSGSAATALTRE
jgi:TonB family protein